MGFLSAHAQQSKSMPRDADPDWDVATVKLSNPEDTRGQHINMDGRRILLLDTTVEQFLLLGYGVQKSQLADLPDWTKTQKWDVSGIPTVDGTPSLQQVMALIRKILPERFGMKLHHEQREQSVFALTVAKGGPIMTENTSDPHGWMQQNNREANGRHTEMLKNTSMQELALILQFHVDRPVVDQTNLKGRYDFNLTWTVDDAPAPADDAPPALVTAIQEQIGLKLSKAKAPVDTLVIDTVSKPDSN
jgi:uncharacterized protein (TIGR03435 family)